MGTFWVDVVRWATQEGNWVCNHCAIQSVTPLCQIPAVPLAATPGRLPLAQRFHLSFHLSIPQPIPPRRLTSIGAEHYGVF